MAIELDHTIVLSPTREASGTRLAALPGVPCGHQWEILTVSYARRGG